MGKQAAPTPPDPYKTAQAQTKSNIDTATAQTNLNQVDQVTPTGSLKYTQVGKNADGTPHYVATTTLTPAQQALLETNQGTQQNLANTAKTQSGRLDQLLAQPFDLSNDATEARLMDLGRKRLDPVLADRRAAQETDLINRGIRPGSDAYDRAHTLLDQSENDAYDNLLLSGHSQAVSDALAQRNQPINELIGLSSGTQVQQPQFASTPQTGVGGTDIAGLINQDYTTRSNNYQQQQSDLYGGLFGLGKAALGMFSFSDERLKKNIRPTGRRVAGLPEKEWTWKGTTERGRGVVAQDVEKKFPHLVEMDPTGYRKVNTGALMQMGAR